MGRFESIERFATYYQQSDDEQDQKNPLQIHLISWNVLGYALGDPHDYSSLAAINKTWNMMVSKLVPAVLSTPFRDNTAKHGSSN